MQRAVVFVQIDEDVEHVVRTLGEVPGNVKPGSPGYRNLW
jgi:hypothetical protein